MQIITTAENWIKIVYSHMNIANHLSNSLIIATLVVRGLISFHKDAKYKNKALGFSARHIVNFVFWMPNCRSGPIWEADTIKPRAY
jgi:ABC-type maltose transport system permease subunit